jgi:hypothetical protein
MHMWGTPAVVAVQVERVPFARLVHVEAHWALHLTWAALPVILGS